MIAWLKIRDKPSFAFDPLSVTNFAPFERAPGATDIREQIIAPVPNKSQDLKRAFIHEMYRHALTLLRDSDTIVAIGYSFNLHDRASYRPLLAPWAKSTGRKLVIVSPDADNAAKTVRLYLKNLCVEPVPATFREWVQRSYPGL
ncbi:MAG TPA: hypothetical protein VH639_20135 [Bryobacteraceae bacterium]|jgi:hypothetical protein